MCGRLARTLDDGAHGRAIGIRETGDDSNLPLARRSAGTLLVARDRGGLFTELAVDDRSAMSRIWCEQFNAATHAAAASRFEVYDDVWSFRAGTPFREGLDMGIREVSVGVSFPAYDTTTSSMIT